VESLTHPIIEVLHEGAPPFFLLAVIIKALDGVDLFALCIDNDALPSMMAVIHFIHY